MSYFDDASLVMIPSGYKTSKVYSVKPTSGDGDLTFTRTGDTATRVGPDGLIEKVRTNRILQSNTFSTTWTNVNTTETIGQAGYDGTNNAWLLDITGSTDNQRIVQSVSLSGLQTFSVYAKAGTLGWMRLRLASATSPDVYFDLVNGVVGSGTGSGRIEPAGNGFYRCSIFANNATTEVRIHLATGNGNISQTSGNIIIQNAQLETGDIATDYIATTTAAVSVGPVANVPRLDYSGGSSCPRLLLEPQRTNSILWSEQLQNWGPTNTTVTTNVLVSPDGYQNADTIVMNDSTSRVSQNLSLGAGTYTASVYAKLTSGSGTVRINLIVDGLNSSFNFTPTTEWVRYTYTVAAATGVAAIQLRGASGTPTVAFWGAQIESGAYATSYIPTLGAAVTRGADAASKTGISSLIGQTQGTLFAEFDNLQELDVPEITLDDGTNNNRLVIARSAVTALWGIFTASAGVGGITFGTTTGNSGKFALAYSAAGYVLYRNGVQIATRTAALPVSLSAIRLNGRATNDLFGNKNVSQALLFPTRLSNADLAALTA